MIEKYTFSSMTVLGRPHRKDLKIIHGRVVGNWRRGQGHLLDAQDVTDILAAKPTVLVVGTGYSGNMRVSESVRSLLAQSLIELVSEPTDEAVSTFNRLLSAGKDIAGAFHLTC
jgi:hypothetical protein